MSKKTKKWITSTSSKILTTILALILVVNSINLPTVKADVDSNKIQLDGDYGSHQNDKDPVDERKAIIDKKVSFGEKPGEYFIDLSVEGKFNQAKETTDIVIVYDNSNSMSNNNRVTIAKQATDAFVNEILGMQNHNFRFALVTYGTSVLDGRNRTFGDNTGLTPNRSYKTFTNVADLITEKIPTNVPSQIGGSNSLIHNWSGGTFTQQGMEEADKIFTTQSQNTDNKIMIVITDGAPTVSYNNNWQPVGNGTSFETGRSNHGVPTIAYAKQLQEKYKIFSVGIEISDEGSATKAQTEEVVREIATGDNYNLLSNVDEITAALKKIASDILPSVYHGTINDPMGEMFKLKTNATGTFMPASSNDLTDGDYYITGDDYLTTGLEVTQTVDGLEIAGLHLGKDEKISIRYKVQIDTEHKDFKADTLYRTNGETTLKTDNISDDVYIFPEPWASAKGITISGNKVWIDNDNTDDTRPDSITVDLLAYDTYEEANKVVETVVVTPNEKGEWTYTFDNQIWYDSKGEDIIYTFKEHPVPGYKSIVDGDTIINEIMKPSISLDKTINTEGVELNQKVTYTFEIVNTGELDLDDIRLEDEFLDLDAVKFISHNGESINGIDEKFVLKVGDTLIATAEYTVTQEDVDRGFIFNFAEVKGIPVEENMRNLEVKDDDFARAPAPQGPEIYLDKTAGSTSFSEVGETVEYSFMVVNVGNVTLSDIKLTDPMFDAPLVLDKTTLKPGESAYATASYTVTQDDLDKGEIHNFAEVEGTPPKVGEEDPTPVKDNDEVTIDAVHTPSIKLEKDADKKVVDTLNETITYTFTVTNTGNVTLSDVKVEDPMLVGTTITLDKTTLTPGESTTGTATYNVTQSDLDSESIDNTATAYGTPPQVGEDEVLPVSDEDTEVVLTDRLADILLEKTAVEDLVSKVGDTITYNFTVTNTGNVTLSDVELNDPMFEISSIELEKTTLAPGESTTGKATYVVTQEDLDNKDGYITNTAITTGTPPEGYIPPEGQPDKPVSEDTEKVAVEQESAIEMVKEADKTSVSVIDETITYTFTVTNTGNVTLTDIEISDPMITDDIVLDKTTLAPGESTTASATYNVTQKDLDNLSIYNEASVEGTPPGYNPNDPEGPQKPTAEDDETVLVDVNADIQVEKLADKTLVSDVGDIITYTIKVTNTGNVTLTDVELNDPLLGGNIVLDKTVLAPGESVEVSLEYTTTQEDFDYGRRVNTADATGTPPGYNPEDPTSPQKPTDSDTVTVPTEAKPAIELVKTADKAVVKTASESITYTFTVTNTGNQTLSGIHIIDALLIGSDVEVTFDVTEIAPGEVAIGTATYITTQDDIDSEGILNTATAVGNPPGYTGEPGGQAPVQDTDAAYVPTEHNADLLLDKVSDITEITEAGDVVSYTFTVTNTGNVTLDNVKVTDPMLNDLGIEITLDKTTLKPGETATGTAQYTVTQEDIDSGNLYNIAYATGTPPGKTPEDPDNPEVPGEEEVPVIANPSINLEKTASPTVIEKAGDKVVYRFVITNTGNKTLENITLNDPLLGGEITLDKTVLAPKESTTIEVEYVSTLEDIDNLSIYNTAETKGTTLPIEGEEPTTVSDDDDAVVVTAGEAALRVDKTSNLDTVSELDEEVTYSFTITNTGDVTLKDIVVSDPMLDALGITIEGYKTTLAPGESTTATASYFITQEDLDRGYIHNVVTVEGTPPNPDTEKPTDEDEDKLPVVKTPAIELIKKADKETVMEVGEVITYTLTITNTGNQTLYNVILKDEMLMGKNSAIIGDMAPGAVQIRHYEYKVTQEDLDRNYIPNIADVLGISPADEEGNTVEVTDIDEENVDVTRRLDIAIDKVANQQTVDTVGQVITYTFTVTNLSNQTLTDVKVSDPMIEGEITLEKTTLAPGESTTGSASYVVTQADLDKGEIVNLASATGTPPEYDPHDPNEPELPVDEDEATVPVDVKPNISVDKLADLQSVDTVGQEIYYSFTIKNTGNVTLHDISMNDAMLEALDIELEIEKTTLAPGESTQATATSPYLVTQDDLDKGSIDNIVHVSGVPSGHNPDDPTSPQIPTDDDELTIPTVQSPSLKLEKVAEDETYAKVGDEIHYTFTVENTGNVTLTDVKVTDALIDAEIVLDKTTLKPGESTTGKAIYVVTQDDLDKAEIYNLASVTGTPPGKTPEDPDKPTDEDEITTPGEELPALTLEKVADKEIVDQVGQEITYTFTITNTGNQTLSDVELSDPMLEKLGITPKLDKTTLAPGEKATASATYLVTQEDLDKGLIENVATATGTPPNYNPENPESPEKPVDTDEETVPTKQNGSLKLEKTSDKEVVLEAGEKITYTFKVTNTGNVTLKDVKVSDPMLNKLGIEITLDKTTLKPGEVATGFATYTVTLDDLDSSEIINIASVTGTPPGKTPEDPTNPGDEDEIIVPTESRPNISIEKTSDKETVGKVGEKIVYTFTITNTGNVTLKDLRLVDNMLGGELDLPVDTLAPNETIVVTKEYTATVEDFNAKIIVNNAFVEANSPQGESVKDNDTVDVIARYLLPLTGDEPETLPLTGAPSVLRFASASLMISCVLSLLAKRRREEA